MKNLVEIITTGLIQTDTPNFSLALNKDAALKLAATYEKTGMLKLRFESPQSKVRFMGADFDFGPCSTILPSVTLEPEERQKLLEIDKLPDDAIVNISLNVGNLGIISRFTKWLPT